MPILVSDKSENTDNLSKIQLISLGLGDIAV